MVSLRGCVCVCVLGDSWVWYMGGWRISEQTMQMCDKLAHCWTCENSSVFMIAGSPQHNCFKRHSYKNTTKPLHNHIR